MPVRVTFTDRDGRQLWWSRLWERPQVGALVATTSNVHYVLRVFGHKRHVTCMVQPCWK